MASIFKNLPSHVLVIIILALVFVSLHHVSVQMMNLPLNPALQKQSVPDTFDLLTRKHQMDDEVVHMAIVVCGARFNQAVTMLKSALMFSMREICLHIFTEEDLKTKFKETLENFPVEIQRKFSYRLHDIKYPDTVSAEEWKQNFKMCATQRVFLPDLLDDVEHIVYVDTDVLFLTPVDDVWTLFLEFDSVQIAGVAWHNENSLAPIIKKHPSFLPYGLNTGIVLMDLARMRAVNWSVEIVQYFTKYKQYLLYGDQDLFEIFFSNYPEMLYKLNCKYNYRVCFCLEEKPGCLSARSDGASMLHGTRSAFRMKPSFRTISQFFFQYEFGGSLREDYQRMHHQLSNISVDQDKCITQVGAITRKLDQSIDFYLYLHDMD